MIYEDEKLANLFHELEKGFNEKDGDRMATCLEPDAIWVNPIAEMTQGRENILEKFRTTLATSLKDYFARYDLLSVLVLGNEVAVVHIRQRPVTRGGGDYDGRNGSIAIYVCHRSDDDWRIAVAQNTLEASC